MRFLVLGAGLQGSACAYDLLLQDDVLGVTLADLAPSGASFLPNDPRLRRLEVDFGDRTALTEVMEGHDVVLSAAPYYFNGDLARLAIEAGLDYSDLGGNTDIVFAQLDMAGEAGAAGCTLVPDVGLAPGMVNVLAAEAIRRLDEPESVIMYVGGLPQHPHPPLNYQVVYSLEGALDYYTTPSWIIRGGRRQRIDPLSELETMNFGELGELEAFHTGGGASTMPFRYEGRVERLEYKTLRYPGHAHIMHAIRELGLLSDEPVEVDSEQVVPRQLFLACVKPHLTFPGEPDLVALRVVAHGTRGGRPASVTYELLDREDPATGITAMERTTGFTLAIVGLFLGRDVIGEAGVFAPDEAIPADIYLGELEKRGIRVRLTETKA
jgi:lysine 6-dehydrogenase